MVVEKLIFNVAAFAFFGYFFWKFISKNDNNYIYVLIGQACGIALNFIEISLMIVYPKAIKILLYLICVILPIILIILDKKGVNLTELLMLIKCKYTKDARKCKQYILSVLEKYPNSYFAHKKLAQIYEKEGRKEDSIDEYIKAVDEDKKDYDSYYKIAVLLNEMERKNETITMLKNLLNAKPDYLKASMMLGNIFYEQAQYKESINVYLSALRSNPDNYEIYYSMGMAYTMLNDFGNAKDCYEKAATINSMLYNSYYILGQINLMYNDLEEAKQYFINSTDGNNANAYFKLAIIEMLQDNKYQAIRYLNEAMKLDRNIYNKIFHEPLFITIRNRLDMEIELEDINLKKAKITKKEEKIIEHLENTYSIIGNLNNNELKNKIYEKYEVEMQENEHEKE